MEAVFSAVRHMRLDVVQKALDDGDVRPDTVDYNGSILLIVAAQNNKPEGAEAAAAARGEPGRRATLAYRFDALAERVRQIPVVCQSGRLLVCSAGSLLCCRRCVRPAALLPSAHRLRCPLLRSPRFLITPPFCFCRH